MLSEYNASKFIPKKYNCTKVSVKKDMTTTLILFGILNTEESIVTKANSAIGNKLNFPTETPIKNESTTEYKSVVLFVAIST